MCVCSIPFANKLFFLIAIRKLILLYIKTKSYEEFYISEQQLTC